MSVFIDDLNAEKDEKLCSDNELTMPTLYENSVPRYIALENQREEASLLVDDIVLKNYLTKLSDLDVVPLPTELKQISDIRLFKITQMVYQKNEYSTYKFASVFNSVQNLNCGVFIIADSDGQKTDFYMGVRAFDNKRTIKSLKDTLKNALCGQFPGVKTSDLFDTEAESFLASIKSHNIVAVTCVANNKDSEFKDNERFIQGLEKLALAMQGQRYTAVVLAKSASTDQLSETRRAYENIYTQLSPFANMQLSYGANEALNVSEAFSKGLSTGTSHSTNNSTQRGESRTTGTTTSESKTKQKGILSNMLNKVADIISNGVITIPLSSKTNSFSESENLTESSSTTVGESDTVNNNRSENLTMTKGVASGTSENMQLTMQNKTLISTLERIDLQLKRIDECESLGMWECAAYFLSESQETAETAAGTYKALMKGEKSGLETSAINFWGRANAKQSTMLREYITNFIHPIFEYRSESAVMAVAPSTLISGNELAIQMGLPRKSICGFPVIEHADFGREVVRYYQSNRDNGFILGKVFTMGSESNTEVRLDRDSLTMHTFITGSTGSGKSNTVYEILNQLRNVYNIPFLVVESAKGEYKNVFGQFPDVSVYGTNPKKSELLRINPFRFPYVDVHVLEHLDRLVELFNVCWPMYAAMPAILKEAMEKSYIAAGWNIRTSENPKGEVFPNFTDLLEQIEAVIAESKYSADSKGDYSGALCTRVRSLTNGINGMIFTNDDLTDADLFDESVIIDLSLVGSTETKSLIMGLLVMKLNEYRMISGKTNSKLTHITVLEEAHNLLRRTSMEQSSESANLLGKSVELLANAIAEMRTYGEGFIIADQSPGLLDMSVIRNTNTKIILRLPDRNDRELVGFAASLNEEQIEELTKLERGVAAIYQNDWVEPVLVKVNRCGVGERKYHFDGYVIPDVQRLRQQLIFFLVQGRVIEQLDFNVTEIERNLKFLGLSSSGREFVEKQIAEYRTDGKLELWRDGEFAKLSRRLTEILSVRPQVENYISTSDDNAELTEKLRTVVKRFVPNASEKITITLSQCFMKDFNTGKDESEVRDRIYKQWVNYANESRVKL